MKHILSLYLILFSITIAYADISVKLGFTLPNSTNLWVGEVDRIKGNQCREDEIVMYANTKSHVLNLDTGEVFTLSRDKKMAVKTHFDKSILTNAIAVDAIKDTGKSEVVNGQDAEVYTYTSSKGSFMLWIAKDSSNFETIKQDLVKRDRLREMTQVGLFNLSTLPSILLKAETDSKPMNAFQFQIIVNEEPIDDSVFEVPKDYTWQKPPLVANTNQVISTTNELPVKK